MRLCAACAVLALLLAAALDSSEGLQMVVRAPQPSAVTVSTELPVDQCAVCTVGGVNDTEKSCRSSLTLTPGEEVKLLFNCSKPVEESFAVTITGSIECTQSSCTPAAAEVDPDLFKNFRRTLTWRISVPERTVVTLDFPAGGLKAISTADACPDGPRYTVDVSGSDGGIITNIYCKGGTAPHLDLFGATTLTVEAPKGVQLENPAYDAKAAPRGNRVISLSSNSSIAVFATFRRVNKDIPCDVCVNKDPKQKCNSQTLKVDISQTTEVEFTCPQPEKVFSVGINKEIVCTIASCPEKVLQAEAQLLPDFSRAFTWDVKVPSTHAFQLDFPKLGMRQISNKETCPDDQTYSLIVYLRTGPASIGTFCKGGHLTTILARYKGRVSLLVPGGVNLDPVDFQLQVGPETEMMAIMKVDLPRGVSNTDFTTPKNPEYFPDDNQMQWSFTVPGMHNYTVHFHEHTAPECLKKEVEVEYKKEGKKGTNLTLTAPQPQHQQGSFDMVLRNCETNRTLEGLSLSFRVSVMRSGHPVLCKVDLPGDPGVSLQIEKVGADPFCEMTMNSDVKEKINMAAGTTASLSFLDCPNEDVRLTASQDVVCQNTNLCSSSVLAVPRLDSCLPMPLHNFTWHLSIPHDITLDLWSPTGSLRQSLGGRQCNDSFTLRVAETDGSPFGDFCSDGPIQKVQLHVNVSVTATGSDFNKARDPFLGVNVSQEISEMIIYRVTPSLESPTVLATPNWPRGMKASSTVSWIVTFPSQYDAHVTFDGLSRPKCSDQHADINVKMLGYEKELMSRREDEEMDMNELLVADSFYLNMSNCVPEDDDFRSTIKIVLLKKSSPLAIILGVVGAFLFTLILLGVICFIAKKKRGKTDRGSSIYTPHGHMFRLGDQHFTKTRSDNGSNIYDSINEDLVYGHLLNNSNGADGLQGNFKGIQVDSYQTFTGLPVIQEPDPDPEVDGNRTFLDPCDTFHPSRPRTPIGRQESLGFQDRRMVDNELYTFKSTGEINTIRLSCADLEAEEPNTDEYYE